LTQPEILLLTPPYHCGVVEAAGRWLPLNLLYVAQAARAAGVEPSLYDSASLFTGWDEIRAELRARKPRFVGSYAITATIDKCLEMGRIVKQELPDAIYILGGVHPTFMWQEVLEAPDSPVDYIVRGEGERSTEMLLRALSKGGDPERVPGVAWRGSGGEAHSNPPTPFMPDLEDYPADFDIVDWPVYRYFVIPDARLGAVATSRGCRYSCTFCSQQKFWKKSWRGREPAAVVEEIRRLYDDHGVSVILLTDEYPTEEPDRWEEFLDRMIALKREIYLLMETRAPDIVRDARMLPKYRRAGIVHVYIGLEATDQAILDRVQKNASVEEGRESIELIAAHGMLSETSFVLGFPEETEASVKRTLEAARYFSPDMAHFIAITPWPYSDIYDELEPHIAIRDYSKYNLIEPIIKPIEMTLREIDEAMIRCYRDFYMGKMATFHGYSDAFRRHYMLSSMKLIMGSSFIVEKMGKLGMPAAMSKIIADSNPRRDTSGSTS